MTEARIRLKRKGWTLQEAATRLGVHHVHLMRVLNGERISKRLSEAAENLPIRQRVKSTPTK